MAERVAPHPVHQIAVLRILNPAPQKIGILPRSALGDFGCQKE
jgi:hypothetical protein